MLNRKIYSYLRSFFENDKKALLVSGARQVGKTFAIRKVGKECFEHFVELNFIENPKLKSIFEQSHDAKATLLRLSALAETQLVPRKTLVFFDEVQECPEIVTSIKFLVDEGTYRYVMSGSLLGVELNDLRSVPVGYLAEKEMNPLDFEEFSEAVGMSDEVLGHLQKCFESKQPIDKVVHEKMLELLRLYLVVGGLPAVVTKYIETNNLQMVRQEQENIVNLYRKDIAKYDPDNRLYIKDIFDMIPSELNAKNKRFILKDLNENMKFTRYENSFLWLKNAGVALPSYNVEEPVVPLKLSRSRNLFKLFQNDIGLLANQYAEGIQLRIINDEKSINFGAIFENVVAQELHAHGYDLYYFNSKKQGELDFVIERNGYVVPIEVKSGKDYQRHNALSNVMENTEYAIPQAFVFCHDNVSVNNNVCYLPIYMVAFLVKEMMDDILYSVDMSGNQ